ncbi:nitrous oxide reductase accessory protein NosL [bacterium]|nr:nitrous oxide reductase accessory protein NosL [bacterium]
MKGLLVWIGKGLKWKSAMLAGALFALPLLGATGAQAAEGGVASLDDNERSASRSRWRDYDSDAYYSRYWDDSPTRVEIRFDDVRIGGGHFISIGHAMIEIGDRDRDWDRLSDFRVLDFATYNSRRERMIDARDAWYLVGADWNDGLDGDLPILAFKSRNMARRYQRELGGELTDYYGAWQAARWWSDDRDWWDKERWYDHDRNEWCGHGDHNHGWDRHDNRGWDRDDRDRDRGRGKGRGRGRGNRH